MPEVTDKKRERRPAVIIEKEKAESYISRLSLPEKAALVKRLKGEIDAELKSINQLAAEAAEVAKGL